MKHGTPVIPNPFFAIIPIPIPMESGRKAASGIGTRHPLERKGTLRVTR